MMSMELEYNGHVSVAKSSLERVALQDWRRRRRPQSMWTNGGAREAMAVATAVLADHEEFQMRAQTREKRTLTCVHHELTTTTKTKQRALAFSDYLYSGAATNTGSQPKPNQLFIATQC